MFGMVVPDVSVEQMVKKADFTTYVFSKAPSWAGERQITDILDVASPPHRMFLTTYRAKDGRHVVLMQSFSYNKMLGPFVKTGKVVYTSPSGIKVWSGPRDEWLAKILLSRRAGFHQGSTGEGTYRLHLGNSRQDISRPGHQRQDQRGRIAFADRQPCPRQMPTPLMTPKTAVSKMKNAAGRCRYSRRPPGAGGGYGGRVSLPGV